MRYIWKNIWLTLRKEPAISLILAIGIFLSAFVLNFSVGIYHEFARERLAGQVTSTGMAVDFLEAEDGRYVRTDSLLECLTSMDRNVTNGMDHFELDVDIDPTVDIIYNGHGGRGDVCCMFAMKNGEPVMADLYLHAGRSFTEKEFESGAKVAYDLYLPYFGNPETDDLSGMDVFCGPWRSEDGTKFIINGEEYSIIGYQAFQWKPMIPLSAVDGEVRAVRMIITPKGNTFSQYQYEEIRETLEQEFGDLAECTDADFIQMDRVYYIMVFCITGLLALIAGLILTVSFQYILLQRRKTYGIYQLCGCKTGEVRRLFLLECMFVIGGLYIVSVVVYHWLALPLLSQFCTFISEVANPAYYTGIGIVLMICSYLILKVMTGIGIKKEISRNLKGGVY